MLTDIRDHLHDFLSDPANNSAFVWVCTVILALFPLLVWILFPGSAMFAVCFAIYLILEVWRWNYSEWVETCTQPQEREAIGSRAIVVNLRIAVAGAAAGILVMLLSGLLLDRDLTSSGMILLYSPWIAAIPLSFANGTVKRFLLATLREVCGVPFNLAFLLIGLLGGESTFEGRFTKVNSVAKGLFAALSGYRSNLSLLHETDYILSRLPTRG